MENQKFDPYHTWLGIAPDEQPADYYRLLGIKRFEGRADVIENAAYRQMAYLKNAQTGPRASECQRLLNEVATAGRCLLSVSGKAAYDSALAARDKRPAVAIRQRETNRQRNPLAMMLQVVLGGAAGIFFAVLVLNYFWKIDILGQSGSLKVAAAKPAPSPPAAKQQPRQPQPLPVTAAAIPKPRPEPQRQPEPLPGPPRPEHPTEPEPEPSPEIPTPPVSVSAQEIDPAYSPPADKPPPAPEESPAAAAVKPGGDVLEIYNTHNWNYGGYGAKTVNVYLRTTAGKVVWKKEGVAVAYDASKKTNPKTTVVLPGGVKYDILRVEITAFEGSGAGLAEIALMRAGKNVALGRPVAVSEIYNPGSPALCAPQMVVDGIADESSKAAGDGKGYWLLPSGKSGWVEILAGPGRAIRRSYR